MVRLLRHGEGGDGSGEGEPSERGDADHGKRTEWARGDAGHEQHAGEEGGGEGDLSTHEEDCPNNDVGRLERGRHHGVIDAHPHDAAKDRPGRLTRAELHRLARHECRCNVRHVAHPAGDLRRAIANEDAKPNAKSSKHNERLNETGEDRADPLAAIDSDHVAKHVSPSGWVREIGSNR